MPSKLPSAEEMSGISVENLYGLQERVHIRDGNNPACVHDDEVEVGMSDTHPAHTVWTCRNCGYTFSLPVASPDYAPRRYPYPVKKVQPAS